MKNIGPDDSFFDLGGHSILAQYMIADVKKQWTGINLDLVTIIRNPTSRAFAAEIDRYTTSFLRMCGRMINIS